MKRHRPLDFKTQIGGAKWQVRFVRKTDPRLRGNLGICYWAECEIYVRYDMARSTMRMVLIHETLHATCRMLFSAEEFVDATATEISEALRRAGL